MHRAHVEAEPTIQMKAFNSRYLGFSIAPQDPHKTPLRTPPPFQFPLLGIFHCTFDAQEEDSLETQHFQFPLLGIFHCTGERLFRRTVTKVYAFNSRYLGFSIAPMDSATSSVKTFNFQFPLLGIFHCTITSSTVKYAILYLLSIPVTWDFPLHLQGLPRRFALPLYLSIPVTWDFPLHRLNLQFLMRVHAILFQFPLLGIFHCTSARIVSSMSLKIFNFQFPLLGIFHCTKL